MAESTDGRELNLEEVMARVGADDNGPSVRTHKVYQHLLKADFTNWDVLCFAVEYIASMVGVLTWLEAPARHLVRLLYMAHYIRFEGIAWLDKKTLDKESSQMAPPTTPGP